MKTERSRSRTYPFVIFLILVAGCAAPTEPPTTQVEVTKITESNQVTGEISQSKEFNQCDSPNPLKLQIQFGDSTSETSQEELVLEAGVTGSASISVAAKVEIEGSIEKHFSSIRNSGFNHQESVGIEIPARTWQEYTIVWRETRREGTVEYIENGETKSTDYSYRVGLEFSSSSVKNIDCDTPTAALPPSPTDTPAVETPASAQVMTLVNGCINSQIWTPASANRNTLLNFTLDGNRCYSIEPMGIFADQQGVLHIFKKDKKSSEGAGIYTPIYSNNTVIEFEVFISSMYIKNSEVPAFITFAVAPADSPVSARDSARFKFNVDKVGNDPAILFMLADVGEYSGVKILTQHYEYSRTYNVRFELVGGFMWVYINNQKMNESLVIPDGQKVFYIGYDLPALAGVDAEVKNIWIDGSAR